jgi:hypothetical protein
MLFMDFDAAIFLQQWHDLEKILETSKPIVDGKLASCFLDCILKSGASSSCISRAVKVPVYIPIPQSVYNNNVITATSPNPPLLPLTVPQHSNLHLQRDPTTLLPYPLQSLPRGQRVHPRRISPRPSPLPRPR